MSSLPTTIDEITQYITAHGCWNREGYGTQQRQGELAQLVAYLLPEKARYRRFLEIGSAAGGTARILDDFLGFDSIHIIDDNALGFQDIRHEILPNAVEWIGDSLDHDCELWLKGAELPEIPWIDDGIGGQPLWQGFDLVHIDAGHTLECVQHDTMILAAEFASKGAVIALHDALCCDGVKEWVAELRANESRYNLKYITTFGDDLGIGVFRWM